MKLSDEDLIGGKPSMADPSSVLLVEGLCKQYGETNAVDHLSFRVKRNEIVGLLGVNGAGKTTTINMILGVLTPSAGTIRIEGQDITRQRASALACTNFAAVYAPLPGNLTVSENLQIFGMLYGVKQLSQRIAELLDAFELNRFRNSKCGVLSSGEQTRVGLAKALLNRPHLLLLDEPTASLDPATARGIRRQIRDYASSGQGGVLWTSHNMAEVSEVCDRVLILANGRMLLEGDPRLLPTQQGFANLEELFIAIAQANPESFSSNLESASGRDHET
jgi:ABC-2 type transport system ATP-binding protein